jgi:acyl-CoA dehydrogenase
MIDFEVPEESRLLVDTVKRFIEKELAPLEQKVEDSGTVDPDLVRDLRRKSRELGLFAMTYPREVGGGGLGTIDSCLVEEQCGWTSDALVRRAFGAIPGPIIHCQGEQRERYLLPAVRGDIDVGLGMTEPAAGSDAAAIRTTAKRDGKGWIINGTKHFITDGDFVDTVIISAVTDPEKGAKGISTFFVDKGTPGFRVARVQHMMGMRGLNHAELSLEDVRVGPEQLLGQEGAGLSQMLSFVNAYRLGGVGARAVGMASRVLKLATDYARQRKQFGKPIGEFQMIQEKLADMVTDIFGVRMMVLNTAWEIDQGRDPREKVSMVKFHASEMLGRVVDRGVQIFGGMGYTKEFIMERLYRDARVLRIYDGTTEIHKMVIARSLIQNGVPAL